MSGRKALLIAYDFPPTSSAGVFRTFRFAKHLPAYGWKPLILTASGETGDESGHRLLRELPDGMLIERVRLWASQKEPATAAPPTKSPAQSVPKTTVRNGERGWILRAAANAWQFATETPDRHVWWAGSAVRAGIRLIRNEWPDVLYTTGPPHSVHLVGLALKRLTGLPWVADFRDPWARRPWAKRRNPWGGRLVGRFERMCIRSADRVILNTEAAAADFRETYRRESSEKFLAIPNGCDPDLAARAAALVSEIPKRRDGIIRLLHPGSCYSRRDPRPIVDAVAELGRCGLPIRFEQVGHCSPQFALQDYVVERGAEDFVSIEPSVPHDEILRRMAAADFLLLIQPETPLQVPGKLYEMLPFRKPIVAVTDEGATADIVRRYRLGIVVSTGNPAALASSLGRLVEDAAAADTLSSGAVDALDAFDGKTLTGHLGRLFDSAAQRRPADAEERGSAATTHAAATST